MIGKVDLKPEVGQNTALPALPNVGSSVFSGFSAFPVDSTSFEFQVHLQYNVTRFVKRQAFTIQVSVKYEASSSLTYNTN